MYTHLQCIKHTSCPEGSVEGINDTSHTPKWPKIWSSRTYRTKNGHAHENNIASSDPSLPLQTHNGCKNIFKKMVWKHTLEVHDNSTIWLKKLLATLGEIPRTIPKRPAVFLLYSCNNANPDVTNTSYVRWAVLTLIYPTKTKLLTTLCTWPKKLI